MRKDINHFPRNAEKWSCTLKESDSIHVSRF